MNAFRSLGLSSLALAVLLAFSGPALSQPCAGQWGGGPAGPRLTAEQVREIRQLHENHWKTVQPLMQQRYAKLAEMEHLLAAGLQPDDAKLQAARTDLRAIDAKLYAAEAALLKQLGEKGVPYMPRHGMRGCPGYGMGQARMGCGGACPGYDGGCPGYGPALRGGCPGADRGGMPHHGYGFQGGCSGM